MKFEGFSAIFIAKIFLAVAVSLVLSSEKGFYRAAVLEHVRFSDLNHSSSDIVKANLKDYFIAAKTASSNGADILIFPEWGLHPADKKNINTTLAFAENIPDPKEKAWNPCMDELLFKDKPILYELSCIARDSAIYIIANMVDMKRCRQIDSCSADGVKGCQEGKKRCPENGILLYNTNVVFDREGTLVTRYHKQHLYFETFFVESEERKPSYFDTDFGVRFNTFICFDMNFKDSIKAVEDRTAVNVAYPTYWYDHVPFGIAPALQQAFAITYKVNVLAANVHLPGTGTLGSGIYSSNKGALIYTHNPDGRSKLLVSNVPKTPLADNDDPIPLNAKYFIFEDDQAIEVENEEKLFGDVCQVNVMGLAEDLEKDYRCFPTNFTEFDLVKLEYPAGFLEKCSEELCCRIHYETESLEEDYYLGVSGKPLKVYESYTLGFQACFLARCDPLKDVPCSYFPMESKTKFLHVKLAGDFSTNYVYPTVLKDRNQLVPLSEWTYEDSGIVFDGEATFLFVGLHARIYDQDVLN